MILCLAWSNGVWTGMIGNQRCPSLRELYNPASNLRYSQATKGSDTEPEPLDYWHLALSELLTIDRLHDPYPEKLLDCMMHNIPVASLCRERLAVQ